MNLHAEVGTKVTIDDGNDASNPHVHIHDNDDNMECDNKMTTISHLGSSEITARNTPRLIKT